MERYVARAGSEADEMQYDKKGQPRGTLRELASAFLGRLAGRDEVCVRYRHSLLGAELVAAGFVVTSREYGYGETADPFRLPRALRDFAFARRGHDLDDSASYPRACLDVFRAGREESRTLLTAGNRERILAGLGRYFFGDGPSVSKRRKWVKELLNALDNDGSVASWKFRCEQAGHPVLADRPEGGAWVHLDGGGVFSLRAYVDSREDMTAEFERLMPAMHGFVTDWLREHGDSRVSRSGLTAKSYFLQEPEGLSRRAKVAWAARRGDLRVTSLQHDGVVVELPDGMRADQVAVSMTEACTEMLGYEQPVEEKPLGAEVSDSESDTDAT